MSKNPYAAFEKSTWILFGLYVLWLFALFAITSGFTDGKSWFFSWKTWDTSHYINVFENSYSGANNKMLVYPPGFANLVGYLGKWTKLDFGLTAMIINVPSYFFALLISSTYLSNKFSLNRLALFVAALSFPCGYFALAPYSDSLFYFLFWLSLWLTSEQVKIKNQKLVAFAVMLLLPWVRITGYALIVLNFFKRYAAVAILLSLCAWLSLNYYYTKDIFYFVKAQQEFGMPKGHLIDGVIYTFSGLLAPPNSITASEFDSYLKLHLAPVIYFCLILLTALWLLLRKQYQLFAVAMSLFLISHNQAFWRSVVRYDWPLSVLMSAAALSHFKFPLFANLERPKKICKGILLASFVGAVFLQFYLQAKFAVDFRLWRWAF